MVKDKKPGKNNQNANKNRNIKKQSPHNARGNDQFNQKKRNQQHNQKKRGQSAGREAELPPIKNKSVSSTQLQPSASTIINAMAKKVNVAKPEQVQEVKNQLSQLQKLLNSYEELEMDKNQNLKFLVETILEKSSRIQ